MLQMHPKPNEYDGRSLAQVFEDDHCETLSDKIASTISVVKTLPINGCITGSCWLPNYDPDNWGSTPDVDVFVFGEDELVQAINIAKYALKMEPGKGTTRTKQQEEWKMERLMSNGLNYKLGITTYTFYCQGVMLNFTFKQTKHKNRWVPILSTPGVLESFDMSIVMQGYDIKHHVFYDMRVGDPMVSIPNPLRNHDCMMWTVAKWVRQFDRVVKYYARGFDTRPMARFYLDMIDQCIDAGCLFDSEESNEAFNQFSEEFIEKRAVIADWLEAHEDDTVVEGGIE